MFVFNNEGGLTSTAMQLRYMGQLRSWLLLLDSWPQRAMRERRHALPLRHNRFLFALWSSTIVLQALYIRNNMAVMSFVELGHTYITMFMTIIDCQRVTLIWTKAYQEVGKEFVTKFHLVHHRQMSDHAEKMYKQVHRICSIFVNVVYAQMIIAAFLFNLIPLLHNYSSGMFSSMHPANGTYVHSVYYELPFDYTTNFIGYLAVFIANFILTYDAGRCFLVFDMYLSVIVFHVWGHLRILELHLQHFPHPADFAAAARYTDEESRTVQHILIQLIKHHKSIVDPSIARLVEKQLSVPCYRFMRQLSSAFGPMLAAYLTFHQLCGCLLLLECSSLDSEALGEYGLLTLVLFQQLIQISIVYELIGSQSEKVKNAVYALPWECMDARGRGLLLFFLQNVQEPITLKAMGVVSVGVQTMAGILRRSASYFIMLRTVDL
ncbi:uncharacterized protein LOC126371645 [Pectinophora gossypiella]|uniref:uncharacterized protein LOC126371645 n=1 Tax=Pectinophora gossypiella TaxID=13191 RepID=UPI00214F533C|nr:uncharacterized protein LOC126371645 [Pectinophora gossypiella]